ncbi:4-phosphoerythronate dehydrogenase [Muribaculum sp.]|uniref:4-phosphoerythronate dehydrogenase n=1 Tax=Muribaculum sp. TaxID=1918611 RepID=UPI0023C809C3|nr:4-phosphoerythronate dehydrogenase [Muribaculum sp.]MDE5705871.1 4-phosphoerythronate dehydrogenase [Muribaculum sp.]
MKFIIEKNIPFIHGLLEGMADVEYLAPEEITPEKMRDADALITRTRTRCNASLLDGSRCRFIATATIGTDHIDLDYCRDRGITVANAPGCNAPAVAQYVFASILAYRKAFGQVEDATGVEGGVSGLSNVTLAVVGVGNVGSIVARWGEGLGMRVLRVDPLRARDEGPDGFSTLADAAREADIITFHTPLTRSGSYPTYHMADAAFFSSLKRRPLIINSARGPVVDNVALVEAIDNGSVGAAAIDCWEGEPAISSELLDRAFIATPHIAGYSREGKIRATSMALDAISRFFALPPVSPSETVGFPIPEHPSADEIASSYDPLADTAALRLNPSAFEALRNGYNYRGEVR